MQTPRRVHAASCARAPARRRVPVASLVRRLAGDAPAAREAGALFVLIGLLGLANDVLPGTIGHGQGQLVVVDAAIVVVGIACFLLPWSRWDDRWTLVLAVLGLAGIAWSNGVSLDPGPTYGLYFVVVFVWVGTWHRPLTSLALAPVAAVAYLAPVLVGSDVPTGTESAIWLVVPVCVLVGETIAHNAQLARAGAAQLRHQALHDGLTGLANRDLLVDRATQMIARARRSGAEVYALFVDLDEFKAVNDTLGHSAGDELLKLVSRRVGSVMRGGETLGRLGGDEFVVLLESPSADGGPVAVARRIIAALAEPADVGGGPAPIRCSIGIAPARGHPAGVLLADADVAMYRAKACGKDRYVRYEEGMRSV